MITFTGVTKRYPDGTVAVDDLSLEVPEGCLTVFVGPSGCGKTTSMRMINRMVDPTSGTVTVDGRDVAGVDPVTLRLGIGYVIQSGGLMPHQRVIDNVATVPVLLGQSRRAARRAAYEVLERVGLDPKLAERYPAQLSGGQQQRVGVARALAADPPILLMDEPFSAVDPVVRDELQAEILRLQSELRKTIVFVTHDIDEAVKLGDAVAVFGVGGALQQYDPPQRLLSNPANDFVAGFVGADRGYRLLQFFSAESLDLQPVPTVTEEEIDGLSLAPDEWRLVTADDGSPFGWIDADGVERHHRGASLYDSVTAGGSLFHPDGTLRSALDAALSSPSGIGVAVDGRGAVIGGTAAEDVIDSMESQRQDRDEVDELAEEEAYDLAEEEAPPEDEDRQDDAAGHDDEDPDTSEDQAEAAEKSGTD
jgi:osmoprotectant transport system ATP-binding protein